MSEKLTEQQRVYKEFSMARRAKTQYPPEYLYNTPGVPIPLTQTTLSYRGGGKKVDETDPYALEKELMVDVYKNPFDTGHEFYTRKTYLDAVSSFVNYRSRTMPDGSYNELHGPLLLGRGSNPLSGDFDFYATGYRSHMNKLGADFISRTIPTQSHASLAQFAGELREGLPDILGFDWKGKGGLRPSRDGGQLSLQFGWIPFIKDLSKMFNAVVNSKQLFEQYVRNSAEFGSTVRRNRVSDPVVQVVSDTIQNSVRPDGLPSDSYWDSQVLYMGGSPTVDKVRRFETLTTQASFSSRYMYSVNEAEDLLSRLDYYATKANYILGFKLTPDVLYELTPWSWLLDWQTDIGSILKNASLFADGNLVLQYGYVMFRETREIGYSSPGLVLDSNTKLNVDTIWKTEYKTRVKASPYGFGVSNENLSQNQIDTLLALVTNGRAHTGTSYKK